MGFFIPFICCVLVLYKLLINCKAIGGTLIVFTVMIAVLGALAGFTALSMIKTIRKSQV